MKNILHISVLLLIGGCTNNNDDFPKEESKYYYIDNKGALHDDCTSINLMKIKGSEIQYVNRIKKDTIKTIDFKGTCSCIDDKDYFALDSLIKSHGEKKKIKGW